MLREARDARGLEVAEVARALRLPSRTIAALEADDLSALPAPIFVRGYLGAYAKLLGHPADEFLAAYARIAGDPEPPPLTISHGTGDEVHSRSGRVALVSWLVGLAAVAMVVMWWYARPAPEPADTTATLSLEPPANREATHEPPVESAAPSVVVQDEPLRAVEPSPPVADPVPEIEVRLEFEQDSWAEVTDAAARRLYFDLARTGETVTVEGRPPLTVFLGNSPGVRVFVEGERFDQSAFNRRGNVARFQVEAESGR